ncbi:MAG: IclR family transcriptional regulator [Ramlibacter sp.]|jgi:DNA-binding IclR family transcriptional regulator|uniref:IclR family transcriptional regulator n=1 Tax=Ramlibacter sp. TaxID=1917967 RepID=UPI00260E40E4|nr:IclR family transcriptional regulator C-terminal domain-containing protein [Ramlibacter sp.]MDB5752106.1 IclR family transcriptional regulator [Ramlibacter sp.]
MTKFARMIDVLDLYSEHVSLLTAQEVAALLQVSRPTAFRYMRELSTAGFLANYSGRYSLGARIITLDYRIRTSDPVLQQAQGVMRELCAETACGAILCRMYNDDIVHVHHEAGYDDASLQFFGRGMPLPLFRGSASKAMLAFLPPARLKKLYERHRADPDVLRIGSDWPRFQAYFAAIRGAGSYMSDQEIDQGTVGIAAPIVVPRLGPVGVIALVFSVDRLALMNCEGLATVLRGQTRELAQRLHLLAEQADA